MFGLAELALERYRDILNLFLLTICPFLFFFSLFFYFLFFCKTGRDIPETIMKIFLFNFYTNIINLTIIKIFLFNFYTIITNFVFVSYYYY